MSDVDQLIDELFPKCCTEKIDLVPRRQSVEEKEVPASQANWDACESPDDAANNCNGDNNRTRSGGVVRKVTQAVVPGAKDTTTVAPFTKTYFDDSDEEQLEPGRGKGKGDAVSASFVAVPFPFLPVEVAGACMGKCFVTNIGAECLSHPSVSRLLLVAERTNGDRLSKQQLLERKGAFHAINPAVGNGASDKYTQVVGGAGGCPFMVCCRCNCAVIRLQGAAWEDMDGERDLYLTVRNYYPDWSHLASLHLKGQSRGDDKVRRALKADAGSAAYCCQCSWLTVKSSQEVIETQLTDIALFMEREVSLSFATQLPLQPTETRRPPLWICRGH